MPVKHKGVEIVFDAEPLIAYLEDEPGSERVEEYLNKMKTGDLIAGISPVQITEVCYVAERLGSREVAIDFFRSLDEDGLKTTSVKNISIPAAEFKSMGHSLGDSFALATAYEEMATLIVGADSDFDMDTTKLPLDIERMRDQAV